MLKWFGRQGFPMSNRHPERRVKSKPPDWVLSTRWISLGFRGPEASGKASILSLSSLFKSNDANELLGTRQLARGAKE